MKTILIIGLGKFGMHMAQKFIDKGHEVMAIERDETRADNAASLIQQILIGDATEERLMQSVGVSDFDLVVVALGNDFQSTLEITVLLKDLGCKYIIARATSDKHKKLLLRNGADHVVYAEREAAERLAVIHGDDNVFNFVELTPEVGIYEVVVPSAWCGKSIQDLDIRNVYNVSVLATKDKVTDRLLPLPSARYIFEAGEHVMVMGSMEDVENLNRKKR